MGKLYETFNKIERGRQMCVDSLNAMGTYTPSDAQLEVISNNIKNVGDTIDITKRERMWVRPSDWIDTEQILLNAPEIDEYIPFAVYLIHNNRPTITLTITPLGTSTSSAYTSKIRNAYYLSDGTIYTAKSGVTKDETIEHTWDESKDISTTLGYNLRYLIAYMHNNKPNASSFGSESDYGIGDSLLEMVFKNPFDASKTIHIPHCSYLTSKINVQRIHILDCNYSIPNNNYDYNSLKEFQHDTHGTATMSAAGIFTYSLGTSTYGSSNINLILPNATKLYSAYGNSGWYVKCNYIYMPNVEEIYGATGSSNYGSFYATYIHAPKLSKITNKSITFNGINLDNTLLTDTTGVSTNTIRYLDLMMYRVNTADGTLKHYNGTSVYNPIITRLTNTTACTDKIVKIDLPNLQYVDFPGVFGNNFTTELHVGDGFKSNLDISKLTYLPTIDILELLRKLADVNNEEETYTLTLGTTLLAMLSDEEKAIATNKGWVLN